MNANELNLAVAFAKALGHYHDSNPEVGMGPSRETLIKEVESLSGVKLDIKLVLDEWEKDDEYEKNSRHLCSACGRPMVERVNRRTGKPFWGCSGFPKCRGPKRKKEIQYYDLEYDDLLFGSDIEWWH